MTPTPTLCAIDRGSGAPLDVYNPATGEHLATVDTASAEDVDRAVKSARKAFTESWGTNIAPTERGRLLARFADIVEDNIDEIRCGPHPACLLARTIVLTSALPPF